jgi:peptidoglycan lytic transglycosylase
MTGMNVAIFAAVKRYTALVMCLAISTLASSCASRRAPVADPPTQPTVGPAKVRPLRTQVGLASYYGGDFHGRTTASGQRFDMHQRVAAHPSYPFGTRVRVTNLENLRQIIVTIIDRGPTPRYQAEGVIIDLSRGVAKRLGFIQDGRQRVRVEVVKWGRGGS